jgi:carbon monoxide dehydrogenase subunit G
MKVQLEKTFPLPASADTAWTLLQDIEGVASCMPGATITERLDATHYKGTVAVKFGPASMSFRGEVEVVSLEPANKVLRLLGKGTDSTGSSGASMDLNARVQAVDAVTCNLVGNSEVSMSGKAAAFGGRMMTSVADQVLKQFAANFARKVEALQAQSPPAPPSAGAPVIATDAPAVAQSAPQPQASPTSEPAQLNGLALAWAVFKDWLRSFFVKRA